METATEFADGLGREEYPLLHPRYSPESRMPCKDFSPWIRDRLKAGDRAGVVSYVLNIVAANPGVGIGIAWDVDDQVEKWVDVPKSSPSWASHWIQATEEIVDFPIGSLRSSSDDWEVDLRTALVVHLPLASPLSLVSLLEGGGPSSLAAMMAVHDVQLTDPGQVSRSVNAALRRARRKGLPDIYPDVSVDDIIVPSGDVPAPLSVERLPLGSRSHLLDIASLKRTGVAGIDRNFGTFYRTRQVGCHDGESLRAMVDCGLLRVIDDPDTIWRAKAMSLTAADLRKLLDEAGIRYPKSGTKAVLVEQARSIADQVMSMVEEMDVVELTAEGHQSAAWMKARASETLAMWSVWGAYGAS